MAVPKVLLASVGLVVLASPATLAHNDPTPWALEDVVPGVATSTDTANRVSGVYYGDLSVLAGSVGPIDDTYRQIATSPAWFLCDLEVFESDIITGRNYEPEVDGSPAGKLGVTLFNDGGVRGACHTHSGLYPEPEFNTPGCDYAPAFAEDVSGLPVWLTTACDYAHPTSGIGLARYFLVCATGSDTYVVNLPACSLPLLSCLTADPVACALTEGIACGAGETGVGTVQTAGQSGWGLDGVAYESVPAPCSNDDGAAMAFTWTAVFVDSLALDYEVSVPTVGTIS